MSSGLHREEGFWRQVSVKITSITSAWITTHFNPRTSQPVMLSYSPHVSSTMTSWATVDAPSLPWRTKLFLASAAVTHLVPACHIILFCKWIVLRPGASGCPAASLADVLTLPWHTGGPLTSLASVVSAFLASTGSCVSFLNHCGVTSSFPSGVGRDQK